MKESNKLFELIRSMSKSEKVYFKKYTSMHVIGGENNYIKLFDAFAAQEEFDEKKIKAKLKNNSALKYFSSSQGYLYKLILKCLRAYHSDETSATKIVEHLLDALHLKNKGLFEHSNKMFETSIGLAEKEEDLFFLSKAYDLMQDNSLRNQDIKKLEHFESEFNLKMNVLAENIKERVKVKQLQLYAFRLYLKYGENGADKNAVNEVSQILNDPLLRSGTKYQARYTLYRALSTKTSSYFIRGDYQALKEINTLHLAALEKDPTFDSEIMRFNYGIMLNNRIGICVQLKISGEIDSIVKKIMSLKIDTPQRKIFFSIHTYSNILNAYIEFGMIEKGKDIIPEIISKLKKQEDQAPEEGLLLLRSNIAIMYFMCGNYSDSLKWVNIILNDHDKDSRPDIITDMRMLNILVHYELKNFQLMSSLILSLHRHLSKMKKLDGFSKVIFNHMKKLEFMMDKKEVQKEFLSFRDDLKASMIKGKDNQSYILAWVKKKYIKE